MSRRPRAYSPCCPSCTDGPASVTLVLGRRLSRAIRKSVPLRLRPAGRVRSAGGCSSCTEGFHFGLLMLGLRLSCAIRKSVPLRLRSCSGFGCHVATREPLSAPFSLWWTGRVGGAGHVRSAGGCSSCTEGFHFGYSCSGYGCHVLSASRFRSGYAHARAAAVM